MNIVEFVKNRLISVSTEENKISGKRFFKEDVLLYGVKTADATVIAKESFRLIQQDGKERIFELCEELWKTGYLEDSFIACHWSYALRKQYAETDMDIFEKWVQSYVSNWASCDTLCNHTIGTCVEMFPLQIERFFRWTKSPNKWARRASAVSLIVPARKGMFLNEIHVIASALLTDKEDMVQKGYGWLLKVASQTHTTVIFDFIMQHKHEMPRTALRYAIEKMPLDLRARAMEK